MGSTRPNVKGGQIAVTNSTALAALDTSGLPPGTEVFNEDVGFMFTLSVCAQTPIVLDATDGYASAQWTFANATFTGFEDCTLLISLLPPNDEFGGAYKIETVDSATVVTVTPVPDGVTEAPIAGSAVIIEDALETDVTVAVAGVVGMVWRIQTAGGSVESVTGTAPISVDNTDPSNPVIEFDPDGSAFNIVGDKYTWEINTHGQESILQTTASDGSDFDSLPPSTLQRDFTSAAIVGMVQEYIQRYSGGANENTKGGSQIRWSLMNTANTRNTYAQLQLVTDIPLTGTSPGYSPGLNNAYDGALSYIRWELTNRIGSGGTSMRYLNSDGIDWRAIMTPKNGGAGGPYTIYATQLALRPIDGSIFATPEDGTALRQGVNGLGDGPANGVLIGGTDTVQMSSNYGGAEVEGRYDIWVGSAGGTVKRAVSYSNVSRGLVDRISASINFVTGTSHVVIPLSTGIQAAVGTRFMPVSAFVEFTAVDTLTVGPTIELGNNAGEDNVAPALAVANTVITDDIVPFVMSATPSIITLTTTAITAHLIVQATATTATGRIHILGVFV